jgi:hypothetical protein
MTDENEKEKEKDWYTSMDANELIIFWIKVVCYFLLFMLIIGIVVYLNNYYNNNKNKQIDIIKGKEGFIACEKLKQVNNKYLINKDFRKCSCYLDKLQNNIIACTDDNNILFNLK